MSDIDADHGLEWINLDTGCLHRVDCHAASHMIRNQTKMKYRTGRTLDGRSITDSVQQDQSQRYAPLGAGFGYTTKCKVCKPTGYGQERPDLSDRETTPGYTPTTDEVRGWFANEGMGKEFDLWLAEYTTGVNRNARRRFGPALALIACTASVALLAVSALVEGTHPLLLLAPTVIGGIAALQLRHLRPR